MNAFQVVNTIYQYAESNNARNSYSNFFSKILHHDVIVLLFISFKDAFIIAFKNGKKTSVSAAIEEFKKKRNK